MSTQLIIVMVNQKPNLSSLINKYINKLIKFIKGLEGVIIYIIWSGNQSIQCGGGWGGGFNVIPRHLQRFINSLKCTWVKLYCKL